LGIDVEGRARVGDVGGMARRYFSPSESAHVLAVDGQERIDRFIEVWTLKEAFVKACGFGLSLPLTDFAFEIPSSSTVVRFFDAALGDAGLWRFHSWDIASCHRAAIAVRTAYERPAVTLHITEVIPCRINGRWVLSPVGRTRYETLPP
jgi:4'-phosphopantetheinyl transferase